ncbi:hypothetical protein BO78DRAFT_415692 [Aspergillus sclerotiicarbonarius CBS 121057]|uniref:C2H2-type domain-containing protein n=1 Tax=Aspergillus sclerotiicarbonarius (strain CBS 121057 / IBT 28362) TaxID=1448318 RepID=A0A319EP95_ASPSB|nr:hypothetical protein BO78DRAFT_415692 [Aspergillus sclerotiicarbonarius CBS 121057]
MLPARNTSSRQHISPNPSPEQPAPIYPMGYVGIATSTSAYNTIPPLAATHSTQYAPNYTPLPINYHANTSTGYNHRTSSQMSHPSHQPFSGGSSGDLQAYSMQSANGHLGDIHPHSPFESVPRGGLGSYDINNLIATSTPPNRAYYESGSLQWGVSHPQAPLQCGWAGCTNSKSFNRPADLLRHVRNLHVTPNAYVCRVNNCGRAFNRKDNLMEHIARVHHLLREL